MVPPAVEKLWTTCASHFASLKKSDETFLKEKGLEILANWGVDPAAMQRRAVRLLVCMMKYMITVGRRRRMSHNWARGGGGRRASASGRGGRGR